MDGLERDVLFIALTRPQTLFGVTYGYLIANAVVTTEMFLLLKSPWILAIALLVHGAGWLGGLRDPRLFGLLMGKVRHCPRIANYGIWGCNSYHA